MDPRVRSVAKKHAMNLPVFAAGCGVWVQMYTLGEFQLSGNLVGEKKTFISDIIHSVHEVSTK